MSSINTIANKDTIYCLIGTALVWIALWFMADFLLINLDLSKQIVGCLLIFIIGLMLISYGEHDKPHGED